jgi:hypothetical protein
MRIRKTWSAFLITTYLALTLVPTSFHLWPLSCRLWIAFSGSQLALNRTARVPMLAQLFNPTEIKKKVLPVGRRSLQHRKPHFPSTQLGVLAGTAHEAIATQMHRQAMPVESVVHLTQP